MPRKSKGKQLVLALLGIVALGLSFWLGSTTATRTYTSLDDYTAVSQDVANQCGRNGGRTMAAGSLFVVQVPDDQAEDYINELRLRERCVWKGALE